MSLSDREYTGVTLAESLPEVGWDTLQARAIIAGSSVRLEALRDLIEQAPSILDPSNPSPLWIDFLGYSLGFRNLWRMYWPYEVKFRLLQVSLTAIKGKGSESGLMAVLGAINPELSQPITGPRLWGDLGPAMADFAVADDSVTGSVMTLTRWLRLPISVVRNSTEWFDIIAVIDFMAHIETAITPVYSEAMADISVAGEPVFS